MFCRDTALRGCQTQRLLQIRPGPRARQPKHSLLPRCPSEELRVKPQNSSRMFGVLSHLVEVLTANELEHVLRQLIWAPLGMSSALFGAGEGHKTPDRLSTQYYWHPRKRDFVPVSHEPLDLFSGTGAAVSSVTDYGVVIFSNSGTVSHFSDTILSLRLLEGKLGVSPKDRYRPADK